MMFVLLVVLATKTCRESVDTRYRTRKLQYTVCRFAIQILAVPHHRFIPYHVYCSSCHLWPIETWAPTQEAQWRSSFKVMAVDPKQFSLTHMPSLVLYMIAEYLSPREKAILSQVNVHMRNVINSNRKIWKYVNFVVSPRRQDQCKHANMLFIYFFKEMLLLCRFLLVQARKYKKLY